MSEVLTVLNAFRHHGQGDQAGRDAYNQAIIDVLNAFRHHGQGDQ